MQNIHPNINLFLQVIDEHICNRWHHMFSINYLFVKDDTYDYQIWWTSRLRWDIRVTPCLTLPHPPQQKTVTRKMFPFDDVTINISRTYSKLYYISNIVNRVLVTGCAWLSVIGLFHSNQPYRFNESYINRTHIYCVIYIYTYIYIYIYIVLISIMQLICFEYSACK